MRSTRIIDIQTRLLPDGGASASSRMNHQSPKDSATTAVAKAMQMLNAFCETQKLDIFLVAHDVTTKKPLKLTMKSARR